MARQILGMSLRRSQMRLGSLQARREQFWRFTDSLREHSGFLQERDFDRRVRSITRLADDLRHRVKRWPQTPDSQFYGIRNELMYQVMGLQNYPQVSMTEEDYTVMGGPYDAIDFESTWVHDTWFAECCTQIMHSMECVMETVYSPNPTRTGQARWSSQATNWTMHMERLIRVAVRHRQFAYGSRPVRAWFDDLTIPQSLPSASSHEDCAYADILSHDSDNIGEAFSYWLTIGGLNPAVEHRVWEADGRRVGRRAEAQRELARQFEEFDEDDDSDQELANEFQ